MSQTAETILFCGGLAVAIVLTDLVQYLASHRRLIQRPRRRRHHPGKLLHHGGWRETDRDPCGCYVLRSPNGRVIWPVQCRVCAEQMSRVAAKEY